MCGHKFNFKSELDRHNVVHLTDHKHICPTRGCGKSFKMQSTLKCHLKVHDNLKINCPEEGCDYWTTLQHYLKDHLTQYHSPLLICEYSLNGCTYTTRARSSQSRHEEYCPFKPFSTEAEDKGGDGDNGDDRNEGKNEAMANYRVEFHAVIVTILLTTDMTTNLQLTTLVQLQV